MPEKISILKESGETLSSNIVSVFMIPDTEKKYIITTENAVDPHGLTVLHVSEIVDGNLQKIATDDEWNSIKTIMRAIISGSVGSYQYLPAVENIKASGQYSRDISVSASASKQMVDYYAVGEKSNVAQQPVAAPAAPTPEALGSQPAMGMAAQPSAPVAPSSIFPTSGAATSNDDELIPGISEVANPEVAAPVAPLIPPTPEAPAAPEVVSPVVQPVVPPMQQPMATPAVPTPEPVPAPAPAVAEPVAPVVPEVVSPVVPAAPVAPVTPATPEVVSPVVQPAPAPVVPTVVETQSLSNEVQVPNIPGVQPPAADVQVVQPSVTVPTGQIAQSAQTTPTAQTPSMPEVNFNPNAQPNFAPNASLDEIVAGAQAMFMEGVKNLVQTIQEKVYRELYIKETELNNKEEMLNQREKMINEQMMAMMSNFAAMQGKPMPMSSQPVTAAAPAPTGPTVVSADNDAK